MAGDRRTVHCSSDALKKDSEFEAAMQEDRDR
jgi:hypothetical protein